MPTQEFAHVGVGLEEAAENATGDAKGLAPARRPFANGIGEVAPHGIKDLVGVEDVPRERVGTLTAQIGVGRRAVVVDAFPLFNEAERGAAVQQAFERSGIGARRSGERSRIRRQPVEDAHRHGGEHRLRAPEGVDQVQDGLGIGQAHGRRKWS